MNDLVTTRKIQRTPPQHLIRSLHSSPAHPIGIQPGRIRDAITARRTLIARIESAWVSACEQEASRHLALGVFLDDRETWDKTMWNRYLAAAAKTEARFLPRMRRLYDEIAHLERMLTLPATTEAAPRH
ncbi:MAG: hypothetical protein ACREFP_23675 [Acetobacteraceae bacterium]